MRMRLLAISTLTAACLAGTALPASAAANAKASCVGVIASTFAPVDVEGFKAVAANLGFPNFGVFVAGGAQQHSGSVEACLP